MKGIFTVSAFAALFFTSISCNRVGETKEEAKQNNKCIDSTHINKDAVCVEVYTPVCGCDGKTYSNSCKAENAGVTSWNDGECPK